MITGLLLVGSLLLAAAPERGVVAALGDTTLRIREGHRPSGGGVPPLLLEQCTGTACRPFTCVQPQEDFVFLDGSARWPGRANQALIQYREMGSGAVAHYFLLTLTPKGPSCADFKVPPPADQPGPGEEQLWGNYQLSPDGRLEWSAGLFAKGDPNACRACKPKSVAVCTWQLEPEGFHGGACQRMSADAWEARLRKTRSGSVSH